MPRFAIERTSAIPVLLLFAGLIATQAAAPAKIQNPVATVSLSPAAAAIVDRFDAATARARARFAMLSDSDSVADNLAARVEIDQALRNALPDLTQFNVSEVEKRAVNDAVRGRVSPVDAQNTAYLKSVLPADGWFHNSRDGRQVTSNAWVILQHSPDRDFQREILSRMAPLAAAGEVDSGEYALLYDRTEMFAGRPQRYGSQMRCKSGHWVPAEIEDAANVDQRRSSVGLPPLAEYVQRFKGAC